MTNHPISGLPKPAPCLTDTEQRYYTELTRVYYDLGLLDVALWRGDIETARRILREVLNSGEIGSVTIDNQFVSVAVLRYSPWNGGDPVVAVSTWRGSTRTSYIEIPPERCEDVAVLLAVCGQQDVADLVRQAGAILAEGEDTGDDRDGTGQAGGEDQ